MKSAPARGGAARPEKRVTAEIEAAPEEVHRARLAGEAAAIGLERHVGASQHLEEAARRVGVVAAVDRVVAERDRLRDLHRRRPDAHVDIELVEERAHLAVEGGDAARPERQRAHAPVADAGDERVVEEVEVELERAVAVRHRRRRHPAHRQVERYVPELILRRAQRQAQLADHLRVHVQRRVGVLPRGAR